MKGYAERAVALLEGYTPSKFKLALSLINHMIEMETETLREEMFDLEHLSDEERRGRKYPFEDNYYEILTKAVGLYEEERKYKAHELFAILALGYVSDLELQSTDHPLSNVELVTMGFAVEAVMLAEAIAKVPKTVDQYTEKNVTRRNKQHAQRQRMIAGKYPESKQEALEYYRREYARFNNPRQAAQWMFMNGMRGVEEDTLYKWLLKIDKELRR